MNPEDCKTLLSLARDSIVAHFSNIEPDTTNARHMDEKLGVFVTLHTDELRGCIGYSEPIMPLYKAVISCARAAAFQDPRFPPLEKQELEEIKIEISVLTKPKELIGDPDKYPDQIKIGVDGLILRGMSTGLLLPQVATEQGWNSLEFLDNVCIKAGLPAGAWKDRENKIFIFEASMFSEGSPK